MYNITVFKDYIIPKKNWYKLIFFTFIIILFIPFTSAADTYIGWWDGGNKHTELTSALYTRHPITQIGICTCYNEAVSGSTWIFSHTNYFSDIDVSAANSSTLYMHYNHDGNVWTPNDYYISKDMSLLSGEVLLTVSGYVNWYKFKCSYEGYWYYYTKGIVYVSSYSTSFDPVTILEFDKTPYYENNDSVIHWDISDYKGTYANEIFKLVVTTNRTIRGTDFIQTYQIPTYAGTNGNWNNHLYDLEDDNVSGTYQAKIWYEYNDPVFHGSYILDSYILTNIYSDNYIYVPPEPPEEPEEPDIPNASEYPDDPIDAPNASGINQTVNTSWSEGYYNVVDDTLEDIWSPTYNFTYWLLQPISDLSIAITNYSIYMNESFNESSTGIAVLSGSINTITNGLHPKIKNLITYYLVWLVLLLIMRKN